MPAMGVPDMDVAQPEERVAREKVSDGLARRDVLAPDDAVSEELSENACACLCVPHRLL
jgi:hypothetical protein